MGFIKYLIEEHTEAFKELAAVLIAALITIFVMGIIVGLIVMVILFVQAGKQFMEACFIQMVLLCVTWYVSASLKVLVRDFKNYKKTKKRLKNEKFWRVQ